MPKEDSLKQRRITQACIICRKKKIKCDGAKPECVHCLDANITCQYTEYKKRGPHKGYVRSLEERVGQLEQALKNAGGVIPPSIPTSPQSPYATLPIKDASHKDYLPPEEIIDHLVDLFFSNINAVFPFIYRPRLKQSIKDKTVSVPLLWSVMAVSARFSNHPSIKTDPPYWAGEKFANKANSLIDVSLLEPTLPNLQFWGIMSHLEYARASGAKSWIFGGIAVRICLELGLHKEETLKTPMLFKDGTIDYIGMALRRRIFWCCLSIDKLSSASASRPQGFIIGEYDALYTSLNESIILRDLPSDHTKSPPGTVDPLQDFSEAYMSVLENFGEICKAMNRLKTTSSSVIWPPIPQTAELHARMRKWRDTLPERYRFSAAHLQRLIDSSNVNYINFYLSAHTMYCTGMLALHRGSLAYSHLTPHDVTPDVYNGIQNSIRECKINVDIAMEVFRGLRDVIGCNVLPYIGYCAYIFSTVLMTSTFSSDPESYKKSNACLIILFDTIKVLGPYWPMCERLAITTRDMLAAHSRLYEVQGPEDPYPTKRLQNVHINRPDINILCNQPQVASYRPNLMMPAVQIPYSTQQSYPTHQSYPAPFVMDDIDYNSCSFLLDSALFDQVMFSYPTSMTSKYMSPENDGYRMILNFLADDDPGQNYNTF